MDISVVMWNYMFNVLNRRFWNSKLRGIPVFLKDLEGDKLGNFIFTEEGINAIHIAKNKSLTIKEAIGVLLHEMCHHHVFENHGYNVDPHGEEWVGEMQKVKFIGFIDSYTDGTERISEEEMEDIMVEYELEKNIGEADAHLYK